MYASICEEMGENRMALDIVNYQMNAFGKSILKQHWTIDLLRKLNEEDELRVECRDIVTTKYFHLFKFNINIHDISNDDWHIWKTFLDSFNQNGFESQPALDFISSVKSNIDSLQKSKPRGPFLAELEYYKLYYSTNGLLFVVNRRAHVLISLRELDQSCIESIL